MRAANNKDRWLVAVDPENGKVRVLDTLHDEAWVREVGGFGAVDPSFGLLPDQKHVWFLSERDGWMHLYSLDATAPQPSARQLTQGKWEIDSVALSPDRKTFYINSSEVHPGERHIYAMPIDGGERTRLTSMTGGTTGEASPDGSTFGLILFFEHHAERGLPDAQPRRRGGHEGDHVDQRRVAIVSCRPALATTGGASIWSSARAAPVTNSDSKIPAIRLGRPSLSRR